MRKTLRKLHSKGYVIKHPTGGEVTYQITRLGIEKLEEMRIVP
jgi:DNA-binding PadR family transcriptional regulator